MAACARDADDAARCATICARYRRRMNGSLDRALSLQAIRGSAGPLEYISREPYEPPEPPRRGVRRDRGPACPRSRPPERQR
jgi:hypothetical protein